MKYYILKTSGLNNQHLCIYISILSTTLITSLGTGINIGPHSRLRIPEDSVLFTAFTSSEDTAEFHLWWE